MLWVPGVWFVGIWKGVLNMILYDYTFVFPSACPCPHVLPQLTQDFPCLRTKAALCTKRRTTTGFTSVRALQIDTGIQRMLDRMWHLSWQWHLRGPAWSQAHPMARSGARRQFFPDKWARTEEWGIIPFPEPPQSFLGQILWHLVLAKEHRAIATFLAFLLRQAEVAAFGLLQETSDVFKLFLISGIYRITFYGSSDLRLPAITRN